MQMTRPAFACEFREEMVELVPSGHSGLYLGRPSDRHRT